ncbi:hypothetical protein cce_4981 [Crocosphaera subtropica ATCC 51142]|uniref:MobA/VirD2-like nuclease domain-containing protein n=1 Tax=Crocosphaera subtropica (strain ATCC 51142 / BH68) TaxID=43989 RepID=B1X2G6_CROS5|nr:hypothetical protein cce_4981 [Crocosphaera subtropica ATCC 51142]
MYWDGESRVIGKVTHGRDAYSLLRYVADKEGAYQVGGNVAFNDPVNIAREFRKGQALHRTINRYVWHTSLSTAKHENLDDKTWKAIAKDYLREMGFNKHQYVVYRHTDADHNHIHIVANRINIIDGSAVDDAWSKYRTEAAIRKLESAYNLQVVEPSHGKERKSPTTGEQRMQARTQTPLPRVIIQDALDKILSTITSPEDLKNKLKTEGIETRFRKRKDKTISGISFSYNGIAFGGGKLGKRYSWTRIQQQLRENQADSATQKKHQLNKLYQSLASQTTQVEPKLRDIIIAGKLLKKGYSSRSVKAVLTQSPIIQSYKQSENYQEDKALRYIDKVYKSAQRRITKNSVQEVVR